MSRRLFRSRKGQLAALVFLVLLVLAWKASTTAWAVLQAGRDATALMAVARELQRDPANDALLAATAPALWASAGSLATLQAEVRPFEPLLALTRPLPPRVSWLADAPDALAVAAPLAATGAALARPLSTPTLDPDAKGSRLERLLAAAGTLGPEVPTLRQRLEDVKAPIARLRGRPLGGPLAPLGPLIDRIAEALPAAPVALDLLEVLGPALGMEGSRTYLLLGQNSSELRATGGFIGSAGPITLDKGSLVHLEYASSYLLDQNVAPLPPPAPYVRYLGLGGWYLRDANWWPDFPATAAQVEQAWQRAGGAPVDGVIAIDTAAVEALLRAAGPLEVPEYGSVSADAFEREAAQQLYSTTALKTAETFHQARGAFLGAVGRALVDRLARLSPSDLPPLAGVALRLLNEKHVQLAFKDQRLLRITRANGWDGAIPPVEGDSLYVVDTSVSYGDSHEFVSSDADLHVVLGDVGYRQSHELVLDYRNGYPRGLPAWMPPVMVGGMVFDPASGTLKNTSGFWGDWLRVYLPSDAHDIVVEGLADTGSPEQRFGRVVVAGYLALPPGAERSVRIRYVTDIAERPSTDPYYRLYLQKQAGLPCRPIGIRVTWPGGNSAGYGGCPSGDGWIEIRDRN